MLCSFLESCQCGIVSFQVRCFPQAIPFSLLKPMAMDSSAGWLDLRSQKMELQAWELLDAARCESAGLVEALIAEATQTPGR